MPAPVNLTADQVRKIFSDRAKGKQLDEIGEPLGISKHTVGRILHRERYDNVSIDRSILQTVRGMYRKDSRSTNASKPAEPEKSFGEAVSDFSTAAEAFVKARQAALDSGVEEFTLEAIMDNLQGKKK